jgi:hypothetical protein
MHRLVDGTTKTVWGDATPRPADAPPRIVRRPAWTRVGPGVTFAAIGTALFATGVADTAPVMAMAFVCIVGGLSVAAMYFAQEVCSGCGRPIDWKHGTVPVADEHTEALKRAVHESDTETIVFSLTGVPLQLTGAHATVDVTWCKCRACGTLGVSTHRTVGDSGHEVVRPVPVAGPHLITLAERTKF